MRDIDFFHMYAPMEHALTQTCTNIGMHNMAVLSTPERKILGKISKPLITQRESMIPNDLLRTI